MTSTLSSLLWAIYPFILLPRKISWKISWKDPEWQWFSSIASLYVAVLAASICSDKFTKPSKSVIATLRLLISMVLELQSVVEFARASIIKPELQRILWFYLACTFLAACIGLIPVQSLEEIIPWCWGAAQTLSQIGYPITVTVSHSFMSVDSLKHNWKLFKDDSRPYIIHLVARMMIILFTWLGIAFFQDLETLSNVTVLPLIRLLPELRKGTKITSTMASHSAKNPKSDCSVHDLESQSKKNPTSDCSVHELESQKEPGCLVHELDSYHEVLRGLHQPMTVQPSNMPGVSSNAVVKQEA